MGKFAWFRKNISAVPGIAVSWHTSRLAWLVLAASVFISLAAWHYSTSAIWRTASSRFEARVADVRAAIVARLQEQQVALKGGVGLFNASQNVTREEWRRYYESLDAKHLLPGLQGFGYAEILAPNELADHVSRLHAEGFAHYTVKPQGKRQFYSPVVYLEPFDERNRRAFGYDMWSEPVRRAAMERARDTGQAAVSGMVTLVQETDTDVQRGFLMYLPLYRAEMPQDTIPERKAAIKGFVYSPFRIRDLMKGILGTSPHKINFRIYDGDKVGPDHLLYDSDPDQPAGNANFEKLVTVSILGHPWQIAFSSGRSFMTLGEVSQPLFIAAAALVIDLLLFLTILALSNQQARGERLVKARTMQLVRQKDRAQRAARREEGMRHEAQATSAKLLEANKSLVRFSSIVAHDLRAPLKRIESFVDILREDHKRSLDSDGNDVVDRIDRNTLRMRRMLDSLHEYTKIGNIRDTDRTTNLHEAVVEVARAAHSSAPDTLIRLEIERDIEVIGDGYLFQLLMQNLVGNAIKFRGDAPPRVLIVASIRVDGRIELTVTDNGIGIDPEHADKVFEMFTRLHDEDEFEGTGIGLAVCKKIVTDHGGEIFVDTTWRNGTRIVMILRQPHSNIPTLRLAA